MQRLLGLFGAGGSGSGGSLALYKKHTLSDEEHANELAELVPKSRSAGTAAAASGIGIGSSGVGGSSDSGGGSVHLVVSGSASRELPARPPCHSLNSR